MHRTIPCRAPRLSAFLLLAAWWSSGLIAAAAPPAEEAVQGLYEGTWKDAAGEAKAEVRVIAMGNGAFKLMARRTLDDKVTRAEIDGKSDKETGTVTFVGKVDGADWKAVWADGAIEGKIAAERDLVAKRVQRKSPTLGKRPPEGAVTLLDGKNFDLMERGGNRPWRLGDMSRHGSPIWEMALQFDGKEPTAWPTAENPLPAGWKLLPEKRKVDIVIGIDEDGSIEVPKGGMTSKQGFQGSYDAHVEFRCNFVPAGRSQGRGNSGVDLPNGQEVQVLDSFGMGTYLGGCCGGLYNKKDPDGMEPILSLAGKNESTFTLASLPPLEWQTYDIEFRLKKGAGGPAAEKGYLTVYHNGVKIHDGVETGKNGGRLGFQDHGNAVRYRNIWVQLVKQEEPKAVAVETTDWPPQKEKESVFTERKLETFKHGVRKEWGYAAPQKDTFLVLHPKQPRTAAPLYVVLHSAGHDVHTCLACTTTVGNHDIYHAPGDFFALYLDCKANKGDWWWGHEKHKNTDVSPVDKRVVDTVKWAIQEYGIDPNRVYLCGNSMGGSGTLGIGLRHGDVFAAIKANVPAGVEHAGNRMYFAPRTVPADVTLADPPIVVDYSAPNDSWSKGHEGFVKSMNERKYPLFFYWGPFGHANNHANILKVNDLINSFDWLAVKKNEAYPVFTSASTNDPLPWPDQLADKKSGQVNAWFRWKNIRDTPEGIEMSLFLLKPADLTTTFRVPGEATADVSLRRLQALRVAAGEKVRWTFGAAQGEVQADATGCVTIPGLKITAEPLTLNVAKAK